MDEETNADQTKLGSDATAGQMPGRISTVPARPLLNDVTTPEVTHPTVISVFGESGAVDQPKAADSAVTADSTNEAALVAPAEPSSPPYATDSASGLSEIMPETSRVSGLSAAPIAKNTISIWRLALEIGLVAGLIILGVYSYSLHSQQNSLRQKVSSLNANPQAIIQKQSDDVIGRVGSQISLPVGEVPTVALVSDASAARQQSAFFKDAENGDKILMYVRAGRAILYRPSTDKVILQAPLTFNNNQASTSSTTTQSVPAKR